MNIVRTKLHQKGCPQDKFPLDLIIFNFTNKLENGGPITSLDIHLEDLIVCRVEMITL